MTNKDETISEDNFERRFEQSVEAKVGEVEFEKPVKTWEKIVMAVALVAALGVGVMTMTVAASGVRVVRYEGEGRTIEVASAAVPIAGEWVCDMVIMEGGRVSGLGDEMREIRFDFRRDGSFMMYVAGEESDDGTFLPMESVESMWRAEFAEEGWFDFWFNGFDHGVAIMGIGDLKCTRGAE